MARNVEIKARVRDVTNLLERAEKLADTTAELIIQEDTFFNGERGRLKLRKFSENSGELIAYDRPDQQGPKTSTYQICRTDRPDDLTRVLSEALSVIGVVRKRRTLYMTGQTRIHVDDVEGLGWFAELEVVLETDQSPETGRAIAEDLMTKLDISQDDLIEGAYIDLLTTAG